MFDSYWSARLRFCTRDTSEGKSERLCDALIASIENRAEVRIHRWERLDIKKFLFLGFMIYQIARTGKEGRRTFGGDTVRVGKEKS